MKNMLIFNGKSYALIFKMKVFFISLILIQCRGSDKELPIKQNFSESTVSSIKEFIDEIIKTYPVPGLALGVVYQDSLYYSSVGIKNQNNELLTINTPILAGAISEPMLADVILKLVTSKAIDLDDKVTKYLPYFTLGGNSYKQITIRHLLTHTSGIEHYNIMWDTPNFAANAPEITTRSISSQHPKWDQPGTHVLRSPYNYDILADLISKVTTRTFEDYARAEVFSPLGMNNTMFYKIKGSAMPFYIYDGLNYTYKQSNSYPYNRENGGSGGLHTSAKDITHWMYQLLHQHAGLNKSENNNNKYFEAQFKTGDKSAVGFGWDIQNDGKNDIYIKGSQYGGFSNQIILIPEKRIGVAVFCNISGDVNPSNIAADISRWFNHNKKLEVKIPVNFIMSKELAKTGRVEDSFALYYRLLESNPDKYDFSVRTLEQFGNNLLNSANHEKNALRAFKFCVNRYPLSSSAYLHLAHAYVLNKDVKNAKLAIKKATKLKDDTGVRESFLSYLNEKIEIIEEKQHYKM